MKKVRMLSVFQYENKEELEKQINIIIEEEIILGNKFLSIQPERIEINQEKNHYSKRWYILIFKIKKNKECR